MTLFTHHGSFQVIIFFICQRALNRRNPGLVAQMKLERDGIQSASPVDVREKYGLATRSIDSRFEISPQRYGASRGQRVHASPTPALDVLFSDGMGVQLSPSQYFLSHPESTKRYRNVADRNPRYHDRLATEDLHAVYLAPRLHSRLKSLLYSRPHSCA